jgi:[ribosomal protein S18]-alanine N-acetyltransferase
MATRRHADSAIRLRIGGFEDLDEVMKVMNRAFSPSFGEAWTRSQCAGILPMSGVTLTLAESDHGLAGFSLVRSVADESELLLLAVEPAEQGRGIGHALLEQFVAEAKHRGASRLHLEVRDGNPATGLYFSAGFSPAGRRRNYYHGPDNQAFDAITLTLSV